MDSNFYKGFKYVNDEFTPALKIWHNGLAIKADTWKSCSNFCTYCLDKETLIMLPNCSVKPIKDLKVGDKVVGIGNNHIYRKKKRKIVESEVEAIRKVKRKVFEVELENGNRVKCSDKHLWLTERGWKFTKKQKAYIAKVISQKYPEIDTCGGLSQSNFIRCVAENVNVTPKETEDYMKGYLRGMIKGDGHLGVHFNKVRKQYRYMFILRLLDKEGLKRTKEYLHYLGVDTSDYFKFEKGLGIRTTKKENYFKIENLINWVDTYEFKRGFLAGAFDAEGSHGTSCIRIHNYNTRYIFEVTESLNALGFQYIIETAKNNPKKKSVRVICKRNEIIQFFQKTNPAISRKRTIIGQTLHNNLKVKRIRDLGYEDYLYDIQTSTGNFIANGLVSHNCYARATSYGMQVAMRIMPDLRLGRGMNVKKVLSIFEDAYNHKGRNPLLEWCIRTKRYIELGTIGETFQEADEKYRISWNFLEIADKYHIPLYINTKGNLLCHSEEYFNKIANYSAPIIICLTLTTVNDELSKKIEPNAPSPSERLELIRRLKKVGIPTVVYTAPFLKDITDSPLEEYMEKIIEAGAVGLHLRTFYMVAKTQQHPYWREYYLKNKEYFKGCEWKKDYMIGIVDRMKKIVGDRKFYIVGVKKRWFDSEPYHGKIAFDYLPEKFREPLLDFTLLPLLRKIRQNKTKPQLLTWDNIGYKQDKIDYPKFVKSQENGGFAHICTTCTCGKNFIKNYKMDGWKWVKGGLWSGWDLTKPEGDICKISGIYPVKKDGKYLLENPKDPQSFVYAYIPKEQKSKYVKEDYVDFKKTSKFMVPKREGGTEDKFYEIEALNRL